jgi:hypothetical protein
VKKIFLFGLVLLLVFCFPGCGTVEKDPQPESSQGEEKPAASGPQEAAPAAADDILSMVVNHFKSQGLDVTDVYEKNAELMGAVAGLGLDIAGGPAEIYLFDPETADADLLQNLENVRMTEEFMFDSTRGVPSIMNGNIMLTGYEYGMVVHPEKDKLVEAFKSFSE